MKIQPASIDQILRGRSGRMVVIDADVGGVAEQLAEIGKQVGAALELHYNEASEHYVVVQHIDGEEQVVTTAQDLDGRLLDAVRKVTAPGYNFALEAERLEDEAEREFMRQQSDKTGDAAEKLAWAIRRDTGNERVQVTKR